MLRREFIGGLAGAAVSPFAVKAQQRGRFYKVGLLWDSAAIFPTAIEAFHRGLRDLGWIEGQNITFENRWTEGHFERLDDLARELADLPVDVIVAPTQSTPVQLSDPLPQFPSSFLVTPTHCTLSPAD